jgi:hypothetical protein
MVFSFFYTPSSNTNRNKRVSEIERLLRNRPAVIQGITSYVELGSKPVSTQLNNFVKSTLRHLYTPANRAIFTNLIYNDINKAHKRISKNNRAKIVGYGRNNRGREYLTYGNDPGINWRRPNESAGKNTPRSPKVKKN